jgi:hypothetical protein
MVHKPELLILDEPTSGVDPVARDAFWRLLIELSRRDRVTVFISTHFMNEAERCDRMSMMHAGKVLDSDVPARLVEKRGAKTLEEAFIGYLVEAEGGTALPASQPPGRRYGDQTPAPAEHGGHNAGGFSLQRMFSYLWREALELQRDPVRATLALGGSLLLMFVIGFGITMDVEDLSYAVLDRDQTTLSQNYTLNLAGSRYFTEHPPIVDYEDLDRRMRSGELSLAIEIPAGFARDVLRGQNVQIGAWLDGAMPQRAETVQGYVQGMHQHWLLVQASERGGASAAGNASVETRFRYNPDVKSLPAMVPAVIPLLLLMLPAMLTALAVVREKETGIDHQSVRDAGHAHRVPAWQATALCRPGHGELPADEPARGHHLRCAGQGQLLDPGAGRADLLLRRDRHGAAGLGRHAQPDRGHVLRHDRHPHSGHPVRRPDRSRVLARRLQQVHRRDLPRHAHDLHQPWRVQQSARPGRPDGAAVVDAHFGSGHSRRGCFATQEAGALRCAEETWPTSTTLVSRSCGVFGAIR